MIIKELKTVTQIVDVALKCDRCKKQYTSNDYEYGDFLRIDFSAGYASAFGDGNQVQCDLCSACLYEMISTFSRVEYNDPIYDDDDTKSYALG